MKFKLLGSNSKAELKLHCRIYRNLKIYEFSKIILNWFSKCHLEVDPDVAQYDHSKFFLCPSVDDVLMMNFGPRSLRNLSCLFIDST